ncbi:MAG: nuclear transport factor 2 family protein, partial [Acidimicrobiales bacterium]
VQIVRVFEDGDYVFAHVEYDFAEVAAGFEVFRFEDGFAVEHWDNLQLKHNTPNESGHTMLDGPVEITDLERTEANRSLVESFAVEILLGRQVDRLRDFVGGSRGYVEHNPHRSDGVDVLAAFLVAQADAGEPVLTYARLHRVLAEGNFVLCASEGRRDGADVAIYDLYRVEANSIVEHWDSIESIPPRSEWLNENGKF